MQQPSAYYWCTDVRPRTPLIAVNGRYRAHKVAGQQRYANELTKRLASYLDVIEPGQPLQGLRGHAWEQTVLPYNSRGHLLWSPCQAGPAFARRHVVTFHDIFALENPEWFSAGYMLLYRQLIPLLARNAQRIIAVSEFTKARLVKVLGISEERITAVHSGIGEQFQPQPPAEILRIRKVLKIPSANYFLSVSSLEPRKNVPRLLEAWQKVQPALPEDSCLVLAGNQGSSAVFRQENLNRNGGRVHFTGYVDDALLPALYSGAHAFLYPSLAEGFGFPVLEAMACGTPALTANSSSLPEVTGQAAFLVDPINVDEISRGILQLATGLSLRATLRERGLRQASLFRWEHTASQTLRVLQEAASTLVPENKERNSCLINA